MSNSKAQLGGKERRRFFRIDDDIRLFYRVIDEASASSFSHSQTNILGSCSLATALDMLTQEAKGTLRRMETTAPEIAEYCKVLDNKIDVIAQAVMLQGTDLTEQHTRNVSLSASGLAFDNDEALAIGTYIEVKMVPSSLAAVILVHAKVVYCKENTDNVARTMPYIIGIDYVNIQEQDRELLIKHIVRRQMQQIRASKEAAQDKEAG